MKAIASYAFSQMNDLFTLTVNLHLFLPWYFWIAPYFLCKVKQGRESNVSFFAFLFWPHVFFFFVFFDSILFFRTIKVTDFSGAL